MSVHHCNITLHFDPSAWKLLSNLYTIIAIKNLSLQGLLSFLGQIYKLYFLTSNKKYHNCSIFKHAQPAIETFKTPISHAPRGIAGFDSRPRLPFRTSKRFYLRSSQGLFERASLGQASSMHIKRSFTHVAFHAREARPYRYAARKALLAIVPRSILR